MESSSILIRSSNHHTSISISSKLVQKRPQSSTWVTFCINRRSFRRCKGHSHRWSIRRVSRFSTQPRRNIKLWVLTNSFLEITIRTQCTNLCHLDHKTNSSKSYSYQSLCCRLLLTKIWFHRYPLRLLTRTHLMDSWPISSPLKAQVHFSTIRLSHIHRYTGRVRCNTTLNSRFSTRLSNTCSKTLLKTTSNNPNSLQQWLTCALDMLNMAANNRTPLLKISSLNIICNHKPKLTFIVNSLPKSSTTTATLIYSSCNCHSKLISRLSSNTRILQNGFHRGPRISSQLL